MLTYEHLTPEFARRIKRLMFLNIYFAYNTSKSSNPLPYQRFDKATRKQIVSDYLKDWPEDYDLTRMVTRKRYYEEIKLFREWGFIKDEKLYDLLRRWLQASRRKGSYQDAKKRNTEIVEKLSSFFRITGLHLTSEQATTLRALLDGVRTEKLVCVGERDVVSKEQALLRYPTEQNGRYCFNVSEYHSVFSNGKQAMYLLLNEKGGATIEDRGYVEQALRLGYCLNLKGGSKGYFVDENLPKLEPGYVWVKRTENVYEEQKEYIYPFPDELRTKIQIGIWRHTL